MKVVKFFVGLAMVIGSSIFNAYTLKTMFNWFLPSIFGCHMIGWAQSYGLLMFGGLLFHLFFSTLPKKEYAKDGKVFSVVSKTFIESSACTGFALGIGYIIHLFM